MHNPKASKSWDIKQRGWLGHGPWRRVPQRCCLPLPRSLARLLNASCFTQCDPASKQNGALPWQGFKVKIRESASQQRASLCYSAETLKAGTFFYLASIVEPSGVRHGNHVGGRNKRVQIVTMGAIMDGLHGQQINRALVPETDSRWPCSIETVSDRISFQAGSGQQNRNSVSASSFWSLFSAPLLPHDDAAFWSTAEGAWLILLFSGRSGTHTLTAPSRPWRASSVLRCILCDDVLLK